MDALSPSASWMLDQKLVSAVRQGDGREFARVYDRHAAEIHSYCRRFLRTRQDADDALQQTFMNAYRAMRESSESIRIRPWLYAIAHNECATIARRGPTIAGDGTELEQPAPSVAAQVEQREELRATLADVARLPDEQRDALLLSGPAALDGESIAGALATDRDRVKALVFRARRTLTAAREARETDCADIREQLIALSGGSLRRRALREHLARCEGCQEFRRRAHRERRALPEPPDRTSPARISSPGPA